MEMDVDNGAIRYAQSATFSSTRMFRLLEAKELFPVATSPDKLGPSGADTLWKLIAHVGGIQVLLGR